MPDTIAVLMLPFDEDDYEELTIVNDGLRIIMSFTISKEPNGIKRTFEIIFNGVAVFSFKRSPYADIHYKKSFQRVVEVVDSPWVDQLRQNVEDKAINPRELRHYSLFIDSHGYYDVACIGVDHKET